MRWDEAAAPLDHHHRPRRPHRARGSSPWRTGRSTGRSCRASPASTKLPGPHVPHQPLGLRLHRRRLRREPHQARRQAGRHHRHRRDGRSSASRTSASRPSICTSSSARRRRSTSATTARPIPNGRASLDARLAAASAWTTSTSWSAAATRTRTSSATAGPTSSATSAARQAGGRKLRRRLTRAGAALADGAGRLPEDGTDPRPGRRRSSRDPATAEALKPWYRQFCKRPCFHDEYLDDVQPAERHPGRHRRPGRRAVHRERRRRRRRRVRGRLPDLRHRLRGRHDVHPPRRLRHRSGAAA